MAAASENAIVEECSSLEVKSWWEGSLFPSLYSNLCLGNTRIRTSDMPNRPSLTNCSPSYS
jgi:hypothetical protein